MPKKGRVIWSLALLSALAVLLAMLGPPLTIASFFWLILWYSGVVDDVSRGPAWVDWVIDYGFQVLVWLTFAMGASVWVVLGPAKRDTAD
ncbi:hypothetical protein NSE01_27870 [Novosphingobium sediminis]|uniref:Uncharacterized protein n=1 Tax=Novosphingobium sediminis TaxID=707214 RepID=A0A512AMM4_9SPHN|nr:hypothetical protein NSE01_27870 [Novosphingobium sediminis]